jgi:pimeloyl-ACP methyl ester carboxylesterase
VTIADTLRDDRIDAMAARLLASAPPRFALAGLSMGGYVAFEVIRQAPERVLRLALLDTIARVDTPETLSGREQQIELASDGGFDELIESIYPFVVHPSRHDDLGLRETIAHMALEVGPEAFVRQQRAIMGRADSRATLARIRCKTLVLAGDSDLLAPPDEAAAMARSIEGARLVIVEQCGHVSTLEQPHAVTAALENWLSVG